MDERSECEIGAFFEAIAGWRAAYKVARLHVLGARTADTLELVSARIVLDVGNDTVVKAAVRAGRFEAHQILLNQQETDVQSLVRALASADGFHMVGLGRLKLPSTDQVGIFVAPPTLLHPEGLSAGNRLAVLSIGGGHIAALVSQPAADWLLKAADAPYDSLQELAMDYGLGTLRGDRALLEVVARTAIEVLAESSVVGTLASVGIFMASSLDRAKAKLGFRVLHQGRVVMRGVIQGADLTWTKRDLAVLGVGNFEVPAGAVVQCIASYAGEAHHVQWRADPAMFLNPRGAILAMIDPSGSQIRAYLQPELPVKGKAANDFEAAIAWVLWAMGFSAASFGTHPKTRDAFDVIATTPRGDFLVVECTLGLLRAEGKLSRLAARTAKVRDSLASSNMKHLRVLPVIVTAMTAEQVAADAGSAADLGVLVITSADLDEVQNELVRFPDADMFFERGLRTVQDRQSARKAQNGGNQQADSQRAAS
ncbi:MAG: hypothetical protein Q8S92_04765 [Hydrogenophaga sp.]|uniref:hypothetical protein n=1 Tax=Hydrogenophaga sp. TaxID=1904254 RepID=UPI0027373A0D|nr:hypothetical protein [Hydrogenophaga sp.]MDP3348290.1 hypothetical protein [Hydrogenophaga sp.]